MSACKIKTAGVGICCNNDVVILRGDHGGWIEGFVTSSIMLMPLNFSNRVIPFDR